MALQSACLTHKRVVTQAGKQPGVPLLVATKQDLIRRIHKITDPVETFSMKATLTASVGNLYGGEVTDYTSISGYIFYQKPDDIRVLGLDPLIHGTAFDMASTGPDFRLSVPAKTKFYEGKNDSPATSKNKLENLRPIAFLNSLIIRPPDPNRDIALIEDDTNETKAVYILILVRHEQDEYRLLRNVYFDRRTLQINRQKTFDAKGVITSDTKYGDWKTFSGISFPTNIDIQRPQDGYEVKLVATEVKMNTPEVTAERFVLNPPQGVEPQILK